MQVADTDCSDAMSIAPTSASETITLPNISCFLARLGPRVETRVQSNTAKLKGARYLPQPQSFPQLHSFLSFIGQFLPVFLQFGLSAAKETVQASAIKTESRILLYFAIR